MQSVLFVFITCPDHASAEKIAEVLVERRLAACVNLIPGLTSVYRWDGKIEKDQEILLMAKTTQLTFAALEDCVTSLHPADLPEIIGLPVQAGLAGYLQWVANETTSANPDAPGGSPE